MLTVSPPHSIRFIVLLTIMLLIFAVSCAYKDAEEAAVISTVETFFRALAAKDSAAAQRVMLQDGMFSSIHEGEAGPVIRTQSHQNFFQQIASEERNLLERMWKPRVVIHDRIAVLWAPYDFHIDGSFSHCGVDAFSLLKTATGWKITGTIYSVQKTGCSASPLGPPG